MKRGRKTDADFFLHTKMRARARYGIELPEHVWRSWNEHIATAPLVGQFKATDVRAFMFHGRTFYALCSSRRVTTVIPPEGYEINGQGAWNIGLWADGVEIRDREVWASCAAEREPMKFRGLLADGLSVEAFWAECNEGLSK